LKSIGLKSGAEVTLVLPGVLGALPICAASQSVDGRRRFFLEDWAASSAPSVHSLGLAKKTNPKNAIVQSNRLLVAGELSSIQPYRKSNLDAISLQKTEHSKLIQALRDERFRCWAFGCHGIWDSVSPGNSLLIVSTDEVLTVSEIQNEQLAHCRLAFLGACETGMLDVSGGLAEQIGFPASLVEG
jgi:CHAT domain-containing protein